MARSTHSGTQGELPRVAGTAEFAELANVGSSSTVTNWRRRFDDFPEPVQDLAMGPVYLEADCEAFLRRHPELMGGARRIPEETRTLIRDAVTQGLAAGAVNVSQIAATHDVSRSSVYEIAGDLLFGEALAGSDPVIASA
jgi:hypothetical protein